MQVTLIRVVIDSKTKATFISNYKLYYKRGHYQTDYCRREKYGTLTNRQLQTRKIGDINKSIQRQQQQRTLLVRKLYLEQTEKEEFYYRQEKQGTGNYKLSSIVRQYFQTAKIEKNQPYEAVLHKQLNVIGNITNMISCHLKIFKSHVIRHFKIV